MISEKVPYNLSVFFHNYYGNDYDWLRFFSSELDRPYYLFYNIVTDSYQRLKDESGNSALRNQTDGSFIQQLIIRNSTNKGKDIGGKLVLMDAYLKLDTKSEYLLLLHDKQSLHQHNGQQWKEDLMRIAEKKYLEKALDVFNSSPSAGIVASANAIRNEWDNEQQRNAYTNSELIRNLKEQYGIYPSHLQFVAGTMFWVRASIFENFFKKHPPLAIRATLEDGNVMDDMPTTTHAWERLLCWIVTSQGYQIKGI